MAISFGLTQGDTGILYATISYDNNTDVTGWVCDDGFGVVEARAICNSMNGSLWLVETAQYVNDDYEDFIIDNFACSASNNVSSQCSWTLYHDCFPREGVFLNCGGNRFWSDGPGRVSFNISEGDHGLLYTTSLNNTGRGYICTRKFDEIAAEAVCTYLYGANSYWSYSSARIYNSGADFWLSLSCIETVDIWTNCTLEAERYCYEKVYLDCGGEVPPLEVPNAANGNNLQGFGLTNGTNGMLYMRDGWVCDNFFSEDSAHVVCAEMGMGMSTAHWSGLTTSSQNLTRYFNPYDFGLSCLECPFNAQDLEDCELYCSSYYWYYYDDGWCDRGVWINCKDTPVNLDSDSHSSGVATAFLIVSVILVIFLSFCWFLMKRRQINTMKYFNELPSAALETDVKVGESEEKAGPDTLVQYPGGIGELSESKLQREVDRLRAEVSRLKAGGRGEQI